MYSHDPDTAMMPSLWMVTWASLLSLCWLLPVTSGPWPTFPADAWAVLVCLLGSLYVVLRVNSRVNWHGVTIWVAALIVLPWLQLVWGLLPYSGQAWISSIYLLGFLLAMLIGAAWERGSPLELANALFMAIGMAAMGSVALQLYAWLGLQENGTWGVFASGMDGSRPAGNLGQPNQLATLLLWGLSASLWAYLRFKVSGKVAIFAAVFFLLGLTLTQSRTGLLAVTIMLLALWYWRRIWPVRYLPWVASVLYLLLLALPPILHELHSALLLDQNVSYFRLQQQSELRLSAWRLFLQAVLERPWAGYGWTETSFAQITVADRFPGLGGIFSHSHNLFLDLVIWVGLPIGLFSVAMLTRWFWSMLRAVCQPEDATLLLLVSSVGIHALLEFPLQYAYFLLPTGMVVGVLNFRLSKKFVWSTPRWTLAGTWLMAALVASVTFRDYVQVEGSYRLLRLEQGLIGQGRPPLGGPPDVWALTQMREWIDLARSKPHQYMSQHELDRLVTITESYPSLDSAYRLAMALALNGRPDEARYWLSRICKFTDERECRLAQRSWQQEAPNSPRTAAILWPN